MTNISAVTPKASLATLPDVQAALLRGGALDRPGYFGVQCLSSSLTPTASTALCQNTRIAHGVYANVQGIRLVYANACFQPGFNPALANTNTITVSAAVEVSGVPYPVFFSGRRSVSIDYGGYVVSDPLEVRVASTVGTVYSRTLVSVSAAGQTWPLHGLATNSGIMSIHQATTLVDQTLLTGALDNTTVSGGSTYGFGPVMVVGRSTTPNASRWAIVGDSIATFNQDDYKGNLCGWPERATIGNGVGAVKVSIGSDQFLATGFGGDINRLFRGALIEGCDACLSQMGVNDAGALFESFQTEYQSAWTYLKGLGITRLYQATMGPSTNTNGGYPTTAQTFASASTYGGVETMFVTGTVAAVPLTSANSLVVNVSGSPAAGAYNLYGVLITSGNAKGRGFSVVTSSASSGGQVTLTFTAGSTWGTSLPLPAVGDTFEIASLRVVKNDWLRMVPAPLTGVIEVADAVECNSQNVQTRNGGYYWNKPIVTNGVIGAVTSNQITDANASRGWSSSWDFNLVVFTSGTQNGLYGVANNPSGSVFNYSGGTLTGTPAVGDTYQILSVFAGNGPHPSGAGHRAMAAAAFASGLII